jgi:hypothetical protein
MVMPPFPASSLEQYQYRCASIVRTFRSGAAGRVETINHGGDDCDHNVDHQRLLDCFINSGVRVSI